MLQKTLQDMGWFVGCWNSLAVTCPKWSWRVDKGNPECVRYRRVLSKSWRVGVFKQFRQLKLDIPMFHGTFLHQIVAPSIRNHSQRMDEAKALSSMAPTALSWPSSGSEFRSGFFSSSFHQLKFWRQTINVNQQLLVFSQPLWKICSFLRDNFFSQCLRVKILWVFQLGSTKSECDDRLPFQPRASVRTGDGRIHVPSWLAWATTVTLRPVAVRGPGTGGGSVGCWLLWWLWLCLYLWVCLWLWLRFWPWLWLW